MKRLLEKPIESTLFEAFDSKIFDEFQVQGDIFAPPKGSHIVVNSELQVWNNKNWPYGNFQA